MSSWPHAPSHEVTHPGAYILTAATYQKENLFLGSHRLSLLEDILLSGFDELGWRVQAWAVMSNHYHVVALSPECGLDLDAIGRRIHAPSAAAVNELDGTPGRKVWYGMWDTRITHSKSYLARLAYVHQNPVRHGLVGEARNYQWCSAEWLHQRASAAFRRTVLSFKTDRVNVYDDFNPELTDHP